MSHSIVRAIITATTINDLHNYFVAQEQTTTLTITFRKRAPAD
jgi:hypothetical protein